MRPLEVPGVVKWKGRDRMSEKERPLPQPPRKSAFGPRRFESEEQQQSLMADRLAAAMCEGRLEDFLKEELPESEYAGRLVSLMMGMTGMAPAVPGAEATSPGERPAAVPPPELLKAVRAGDSSEISAILKREHERRSSSAPDSPARPEGKSAGPEVSAEERDILDRLVEIASRNGVSIDWIILRALKLYIRDHSQTGRL